MCLTNAPSDMNKSGLQKITLYQRIIERHIYEQEKHIDKDIVEMYHTLVVNVQKLGDIIAKAFQRQNQISTIVDWVFWTL